MTKSSGKIWPDTGFCRASRWREFITTRSMILILPGLLGAGLWLQLRTILHHDPAWIIHGTEVFLSGGKLYRDVFELNPPLIFYLTVPPVWFAHLLGIFDIDAFILYVYILIFSCLSIIWFLLRRIDTLPSVVRQGFMLAATVALAVYPAARFGQREHLMLIFALPYLLLISTRSRSIKCRTPLAIWVGIFAAFGFALKPYFLLVPLVTEAYLAFRTRSIRRCLRPETLALASMILLYVILIMYFTPDYLTLVAPYAAAVYSGYDASLWFVLACSGSALLPLIIALHLASRSGQTVPEVGDILGVSAICFFIIYLWQMKGWTYQAYPLDAALFLLLAVIFLHRLSGVLNLRRRSYPTVAIGIVLVIMTATMGLQSYKNTYLTEMAPLVRALRPGASIYVFTATTSAGFPLVNYYNVGWSSRFDALWLLPGIIVRPSSSPDIEQYLRNAVVTDLAKQPPDLIFVDTSTRKLYFGDRKFDYIQYFSSDPRFVDIWASYDKFTQVGNFQVYRRHGSGIGG